jgi:hypothetical protein
LQIADRQIPSPEVPAFDGIGANEYIVTVTHPDAVDFISTVDTPVAVGAQYLVPHAESRAFAPGSAARPTSPASMTTAWVLAVPTPNSIA